MTETTATSQFAEKLRMCREEEGLSQTQLAVKLDVSRGSVSFYENAERKPDIEFIAKAARFFKVSCDWLLGLSDVRTPDLDKQAIVKKTGLTERAVNVLMSFSQPFKERMAGGGMGYGYKRVPAPIEISQLIEHEKFLQLIESVRSMKLINTGGITNIVAEVIQKTLGEKGLWKVFRDQALKALGEIADSVAPEPEEAGDTLMRKLGILEAWGTSEEGKRRYVIDYFSAKNPNGEITNEAGELLY